MTREELIRNLKYTMEKHKNDTVDTFGTIISLMCKDMLDYLEQEPKWIPVSEKLPEKSVWVLTYCKTKDGCEYQTVLLRSKYTGEWTDCDDFYDEVIAWMPLPEPYKAESE